MTNTLSPYWKWDSAIPKELIKPLLDEVDKLTTTKGSIFSGNTENVRDSDIVIVDSLHWLSGVLFNYAIHANESAGWNRQLTKPQHLQFASYVKDQFYDWHTDTHVLSSEPYSRKLSAVCLLSDPSEFDGGVLEIENVKETPVLTLGSVIIFPSILRHRVTPVTRGIRRSAACWIFGPTSW